jgi:hypothetical protein
LAHGIYPPVLRSFGLVDALREFAMTAQPPTIELIDEGIGRCSPTVETAIYSARWRPSKTPPNTRAATRA